MILLIIILILILYLALYPLNVDKDQKLKVKFHQMLEQVYQSLIEDEKEKYNKPKNIQIIFTDDLTRTENKSIIYLVIKNRETGALYDFDTLHKILIHEFTHILHPEWLIDHHTEEFITLENKLLKHALQLGYFNPENKIDQNYPCKIIP